MASVIYDGLDLEDVVLLNDTGLGSISAPSNGYFEYSCAENNTANETDATPGIACAIAAGVTLNGTIGVQGTLPFSEIPAGAIVTLLRVEFDGTINYSQLATGSGVAGSPEENARTDTVSDVSASASFAVNPFGFSNIAPINDDDFASDAKTGNDGTTTSTATINGSNSISVSTDFELEPNISIEDFISTYGEEIQFICGVGNQTDQTAFTDDLIAPAAEWSASVQAQDQFSCDVSFWRVTIEYETSGPLPVIELTQSGGYELSGSGQEPIIQSGGYELSGGGEDFYWWNEITQSGGLELSGGGDYGSNEIIQSGGLELSGGGRDFYLIAPDISGIYVLVPDKHYDTWYKRNGLPAETVDVKIPDPFASLAYLPKD